jgi:hypothetical protein
MTDEEAREVALGLIRPAAALGYYMDRIADDDTPEYERAKRAVARVMGNCYCVLTPVWRRYPHLDPAEHENPLNITPTPNEREITRSDLNAYINEIASTLLRALPQVLDLAETPRSFDFVRGAAYDLESAVADVRRLLWRTPE